MFFRHDYSAPGPGIEKDAPEKTGPARFLEILQLECVTLFQLNLLFLVSCLPVITIPPALFAMNQVIRLMVLDQPVLCFYHYRTAFCKFWRQGYLAFLLVALPLVFAGCGAWFYLSRAEKNPLFFLPFMLCTTVFLVALLSSGYLYSLLGAGRGVGESVRLSILLGVGKPLRSLLCALSWYGTLTVAVLEFPISGIYLLVIGFSVPCLLGNFYLRTVLRQYELESWE